MSIPEPAYRTAIALCKEFEGFAQAAYRFPGETWYTIGYGTVRIDGRAIAPGQTITEPQAARELDAELRRRGDDLTAIVTIPLNENQWAALLSLAYNVKGGVSAIAQSRMVRHLNRGDFAAAMQEWDWEHDDNGQKLPGLVRRRQRERDLFMSSDRTPIQPMTPTPPLNIRLADAAHWYAKQRHQSDAWDWLQSQTESSTLNEFARRYRTNPIPTPEPVRPAQGQAIAIPGRGTLTTQTLIGNCQHFRWGEATKSGTRLPANATITANIERMALKMDAVRRKLGDRPILVTSWYRPPAINAAVGGASNSTHIQGFAVDFNAQGLSPSQVQRTLSDWPGGLGYGSNFTHLDDRGDRARWNYS